MPPYEVMLQALVVNSSPSVDNAIVFDILMGKLIQGADEPILEYSNRVMAGLHCCYNSPGYDATRLEFVERLAFVALITRSERKVQRELFLEVERWNKGISKADDPASLFHSLYGYVQRTFHHEENLRAIGKDRKRKEPDHSREAEAASKMKKLGKCRFGAACSKRDTCKFVHDSEMSSQRKSSAEQKGKCEHCSKPGHTKDKCYALHPELRKSIVSD